MLEEVDGNEDEKKESTRTGVNRERFCRVGEQRRRSGSSETDRKRGVNQRGVRSGGKRRRTR